MIHLNPIISMIMNNSMHSSFINPYFSNNNQEQQQEQMTPLHDTYAAAALFAILNNNGLIPETATEIKNLCDLAHKYGKAMEDARDAHVFDKNFSE